MPNISATNYHRYQYRIQVASFSRKQEADELRARLTLSGFHSMIKTITSQSGKTRYRVVVGPYASQKVAAKYQRQLESHKIRGTLILRQQK